MEIIYSGFSEYMEIEEMISIRIGAITAGNSKSNTKSQEIALAKNNQLAVIAPADCEIHVVRSVGLFSK